MTTSFNDRPYRQPKFAVDGAIPELLSRKWDIDIAPSWANPDAPFEFPPPPADWLPLPSPPPNWLSPFDQPGSPVQPGSRAPRPQDAAQREAINWFLGVLAAGAKQDTRRPSPYAAAAGNSDFELRRPSSLPPADLNVDNEVHPRFDSRQAEALQKLGPEGVLQLANKPPRRRAVQPPIFFPFD